MGAMLSPDHADRWQLRDLTATEPSTRPLLPGRKRTLARAAHLREVIDDLIDLIRRSQLTTGTAMSALPTRLALLTL